MVVVNYPWCAEFDGHALHWRKKTRRLRHWTKKRYREWIEEWISLKCHGRVQNLGRLSLESVLWKSVRTNYPQRWVTNLKRLPIMNRSLLTFSWYFPTPHPQLIPNPSYSRYCQKKSSSCHGWMRILTIVNIRQVAACPLGFVTNDFHQPTHPFRDSIEVPYGSRLQPVTKHTPSRTNIWCFDGKGRVGFWILIRWFSNGKQRLRSRDKLGGFVSNL